IRRQKLPPPRRGWRVPDLRSKHRATRRGRALDGDRGPLLQDAGLRNRRVAGPVHRSRGDCRRARRGGGGRATGAAVRRHERDELFQHQPRDAGARGVSARVVSEEKDAGPSKDRHRVRHASFFPRVCGADGKGRDGPRSTPELSFAVRHTNATAGIVITASHNPPHDNGYKAYFADGAQLVEPHAGGVVAKVNAIRTDRYKPLPKAKQGKLIKLGRKIDEAYMKRLETLVLDPAMVKAAAGLKIVFTSIHGVGGV